MYKKNNIKFFFLLVLDTRSDALLPIRHNFDSDLSNYQGKHWIKYTYDNIFIFYNNKKNFSESSNPSNDVPTFTEFMNSTNMFLNRLDKS